jgi:uncharacterized repeat protein (TIGR03803 family)
MNLKRTTNWINTFKFKLIILFLTSASHVGAQTLQTLCSFNSVNGANPYAGLTLGNDGNFYGTTQNGGITNSAFPSGMGTVFKMTPQGELTTIIAFSFTNGANPTAGLSINNDGNFYGTTHHGGITNSTYTFGMGTVFQITTNGSLTKLISFNGSNGARPAALTRGDAGIFYGTTVDGGSSDHGSVFKVSTNGTVTLLASLNSANRYPFAGLVAGNDGNLYGTTESGGNNGIGSVFKVTTDGAVTTLFSFSTSNGVVPIGALTLGNDDTFYGTTSQGGSNNNGTIFKISTNGVFTKLVSFDGINGKYPAAALSLGTDGNFYGTTLYGGITNLTDTIGLGTMFKLSPDGTLTSLFNFNGTNGAHPQASLVLDNDNNFYGTTSSGGIGNFGTVFAWLLPAIITQPQSQTNNAGATVTFVVSATSLKPLSYQWQKNGTNLFDDGHISGATSNALNITNISDADASVYSIIVSNSNGGVTNYVTLTVDDLPFITSKPISKTVLVGSNITFNVTVYGAPPFVFQWYFKGAPVGSPTAGTNSSFFTLTNVGTNQAGNYNVEVVNAYGSVISPTATLTVVSTPIIITQPLSRTNNAVSTATFSVVASSGSALSYQWQKNGTNLNNGGKISGATGSVLTITTVSSNEAGVYAVTVTNIVGTVTSSNATLTVIDPPRITVQPLGQQLAMGSIASFSVVATGTAPFSYRWRLNNTNILNATNSFYAFQVVSPTSTGNYSVVVTNLASSVTSSNAFLAVDTAPTLFLQFSAGYPLFKLYGVLNSNFIVQYNTNLSFTNWIHLLSITNLSSSPYQFLDPTNGDEDVRFYRAFMR